MLLTTIIFDEKNVNWSNDKNYSIKFLKYVERNLNDLIRSRGYVYLNQIYEHIGIEWNPKDENSCVVNDDANKTVYIEFDTFFKNDSIVVDINIYRY